MRTKDGKPGYVFRTVTTILLVLGLAVPPRADEPGPADPQRADTPTIVEELERLSAELERLREDLSKKSDTKSDSKNKWSSPKFDGRIYFDTVAVANQDGDSRDAYGNMSNGSGAREIRLAVSGTGYEAFRYRFQITLSPQDGRVALLDNWVTVNNLPFFGMLRVGHMKPKTSLSYTASRIGDMTPIFVQGRRLGITATRLFADDRLRFNYGIYHSANLGTDRFIEQDHQGRLVLVRLTGTPFYAEEGRRMLHLGVHYSETVPENGTMSLSARPGAVRFLETALRTGNFDCDRYRVLGLESTLQRGPFAVQSEIFLGRYSSHEDSPGRNATGGYVELKYFLTGEHREYRLASGAFGPPVMERKLHAVRSGNGFRLDDLGAWQTIVQWSWLDFDDWRPVGDKAGRQYDLVLGLNWFWTRDVRWTFEYIRSQRNIGEQRRRCEEDILAGSVRVHF